MKDHLQHQQEVLQILKDNLITSQNRMKQQAYQHRSERSFEEGDWVFLRLQPYKQMSLKQLNKDNKLSPKYYGPYKVLQKIGSMAYKLELPATSWVHLVFHVSCLKKVIGNNIWFITRHPHGFSYDQGIPMVHQVSCIKNHVFVSQVSCLRVLCLILVFIYMPSTSHFFNT